MQELSMPTGTWVWKESSRIYISGDEPLCLCPSHWLLSSLWETP